jgi:hypothetical protein
MSGRNPSGEVRIFDYLYTTGGGKSSTTWSQTVAFFPGAGRDLPEFMLSPENPIAHAMEKLAGYKDIDFDENPVFSSRYLLRGSDETAIRSAFTADMRTFMEQEPGWTVEVGGGNVAIYHPQQRVKPENIAKFLEQTSAVLRGLVAARRP